MVPRVTPALPFLLVLGDGLRKARASEQSHGHTTGEGLERERAKWARPVDFTSAAKPGEDTTYVFTPANPVARAGRKTSCTT